MNIPLLNTLLRLADLALGCRQAAGNAEAAARALGEHNRAWQESLRSSGRRFQVRARPLPLGLALLRRGVRC